MPFDPTKPDDLSEIVAAQLRNQFNALKALIDAGLPGPQGPQGLPGAPGADGADGEVTNADLAAAIAAALLDTARNPTGVALLPIPPNDPPTRADLLAVIDKLNELITALRREP